MRSCISDHSEIGALLRSTPGGRKANPDGAEAQTAHRKGDESARASWVRLAVQHDQRGSWEREFAAELVDDIHLARVLACLQILELGAQF